MKILFRKKWINNLLDYYVPAQYDPITVKVSSYFIIKKIDNQFIQFESVAAKMWKVYNYIWIYGFIDTFIKIRSRLNEAVRNDKYLCCGFGLVDKKKVFFIAPNNQYGYNKLVLPSELVIEHGITELANVRGVYDIRELQIDFFDIFNGYNYYSGNYFDKLLNEEAFNNFNKYIQYIKKEKYFIDEIPHDRDEIKIIHSEIINTSKNNTDLDAVLLGYGNYAKTIIIPNLFKNGISLLQVHEIDPVQLLNSDKSKSYSTKPYPDINDNFDVWVVAGYHHMHVDVALEALKRGAIAVIEKPLATNINQVKSFTEFVRNNDAKFFLCFQKRYSMYNEYIYNDLKIVKGEQLNYYAVIYEEALGSNHWYNWPNSETRIVSNGCHWIDHFLFLNNYVKVKCFDSEFVNPNDILVKINLENNSTFVMLITDSGSKRLGVREYLRISTNTVTIEIKDNQYYKSENNNKVIRKKTFNNKLHNLKDMYHHIHQSIVNGGKGDSFKSLQSSLVSIKLNDLLKHKLKL
jgi:predicted dehydrogenase